MTDKKFEQYSESGTDYQSAKHAFDMQRERDQIAMDSVRWRNRRRMAWICLAAMLAATVALFFFVSETKLEILGETIAWFYMSMASVIGTYMGTTVYASVQRNRYSGMGAGRYDGYGGTYNNPYDNQRYSRFDEGSN